MLRAIEVDVELKCHSSCRKVESFLGGWGGGKTEENNTVVISNKMLLLLFLTNNSCKGNVLSYEKSCGRRKDNIYYTRTQNNNKKNLIKQSGTLAQSPASH